MASVHFSGDTNNNNNNYSANITDTSCGICSIPLEEGTGIMLNQCFHSYCWTCIETLLETCTRVHVKCPSNEKVMTSSGLQECKGYISQTEIQAILTPSSFVRYLEMSGQTKSKVKKIVAVSASKMQNLRQMQIVTVEGMQRSSPSPRTRKLIPPVTLPVPTNSPCKIWIAQKEVSCKFCSLKLKIGQGVQLQVCLHIYCKDCLLSLIQSSNGGQIICPYQNKTVKCPGYLLDMEIQAIASQNEFTEYSRKSVSLALANMSNMFHCQTRGCREVYEINDSARTFVCPKCYKRNCLRCKAIHEGIDCDIYQQIINVPGITEAEIQVQIKRKRKSDGFSQLADFIQSVGNPDENDVLSILDLIPTTSEFECSVCQETIAANGGVILRECFHMYCRECLEGVVRHSETPEISCPYRDEGYVCPCFIPQREIKALVAEDVYEQFLKRSTTAAEKMILNTFHCKTPDCLFWCELDEHVKFVWCEICKKENCVQCNTFHEGLTCEGYQQKLHDDTTAQNNLTLERQSQEAVENDIRNGIYMRCPRCKMICQKISGCNHVTCASCQSAFNWTGRELRQQLASPVQRRVRTPIRGRLGRDRYR